MYPETFYLLVFMVFWAWNGFTKDWDFHFLVLMCALNTGAVFLLLEARV